MEVEHNKIDRISIPHRSRGIGSWAGAVWGWLDARTGLALPLRKFFTYPVPLYVHKNVLYSLGGVSLISLALQLFSGILMTFYYDPGISSAYDSVDYITYTLPAGWLVRGVHVYNASALVILLFLHLLRTYFMGAYKKPREITWMAGVLMLLVVLGFAFTGALLPWDQSGYWATKVGMEIAGSTPLAGTWIKRILQGGSILGQATLTRFYVLHVLLLPLGILSLVILHIHQLRYHGIAPAITEKGKRDSKKFVPFFPHWMTLDAMIGTALLILLIFVSWNWRAPLEFPADPTSADFIPRPQWYFLSLYQMLKYFPGPLEPVAAILLPGALIGGLLALPFIDRSEERRPWRRPLATALAIAVISAIVVLTVLATL